MIVKIATLSQMKGGLPQRSVIFQDLGDAVKFAGADKDIDLGQERRQLLPVALGKTAGYNQLLEAAGFFFPADLENGVDSLFFCLANKRAGIDDRCLCFCRERTTS